MTKKYPKQFNHSVIKAFMLLEYFTNEKKEWGVRELALKVDANKSTVYRLLSTLELIKVLRKNPQTEKYSLGLKLFELGNRVSIQQGLIGQTHPILELVAKQITETVHLGILRNQQVFMVDRMESPMGLKLNSLIGGYSSLYCTGLGKILLANLDNKQQKEILKNIKLKPFTKFTITKKTDLKKELKRVKQQGFALDKEEKELGLICLAVPVYNQANQVVAALSAAGPANRFRKEALKEYLSILRNGADLIKDKIGHFNSDNL